MNIFGTTFDFQGRLDKVRKLMEQRGLDALLVQSWPNQYYLSGMYQPAPWYPIEVCENTEMPLIVFTDKKKAPIFLITYLTGNGVKEGSWVKDVRFLDKKPYGKRSCMEHMAEILKENGVDSGVLGFEEDVCVQSTYRKMCAVLPRAQFKPADEIFHTVRLVKEPEEISIIREAVLIAEAGVIQGMKTAAVGVLESEVQKAVELEIKRLGAIKEIESMAQSGIRTANQRANGANWKKIEPNDLCAIDVGCVYKGYGSDLTKSWVVGKPAARLSKAADNLVTMRDNLVKIMKPGVLLGKVQDTAKSEIESLGFSTDKTVVPSKEKGLGYITIHGIGLSPMHDPPFVYYRDVPVQSGMTISFTCGVRFADCTIRFEDDLLVTPDGVEFLSRRIPWKL